MWRSRKLAGKGTRKETSIFLCWLTDNMVSYVHSSLLLITRKLNPIIDNDIKHLKCVFYSSVIDFSRYWRCNIWKASGINISRSLHSLLESMVMLMDKKKGLLHLISWLTANIELNKKHFGTHCTMAVLSLFTFYAPWAWNKDSKDMQEIKNLRFVKLWLCMEYLQFINGYEKIEVFQKMVYP